MNSYIHSESLHLTLDAVAEALFFGRDIPKNTKIAVAKWIASRQGLPGSYAGMFSPTEKDKLGIKLFTGEPIRSRAGVSHMLGEECCRILACLKVQDEEVKTSLERALLGMNARLEDSEKHGCKEGMYCCGNCTTAYWRNLALMQFPRSEERLAQGVQELRRRRSGDGRWFRFPFYHTCLALTEMGGDLAKSELQYAAPRWIEFLPKLERSSTPYVQRRKAVGQRVLDLCECCQTS